jgi:hypothetical protein
MPAPPPELRVRQLLKHAWRSLGLRCVAAEPVPPDAEPGAGVTTTPEEKMYR